MFHCFEGSRRELLLLLVAATAISAARQAEPRKIPMQEARRLVYEVVKTNNKDAEIDRTENPYDREFYYFEVIVPNAVASPVVGHFAVNPWTGDVWNPALCERVTLPALKRLQERIRRESGLTRNDYLKAERKKPICSND
jgi:hypothetical protein